MSATEIIAELPKLTRSELEAVGTRLNALLDHVEQPAKPTWGQALSELAGTVEELPSDYAANHDHYLHGAPKR